MLNYINKRVHIAPLIIFRVLFGFMMLFSVIRFLVNGWVKTQYIDPEFYFSYYGFEWVKPLGEVGMYLLFALMALTALMIILGAFYRLSSILFFASFTYVELIDKTNYLNHYYFVSLVALIMIFLPAHRYFSIDVWRKPKIATKHVSNWCILIIQLQLALVYFYAGVAKLNHDWLVEALPLRIWLPPNSHLPFVGRFFEQLWVAYAFSWFGAIYDLAVPFLLFKRATRPYGYVAVVIFHITTWVLFPIGMFPFIMILSTLIFFSEDFHKKLIQRVKVILQQLKVYKQVTLGEWPKVSLSNKWIAGAFAVFMIFQLVLPWRFMAYPGELFWTEQGYRFSWRVMLMEKAGYAIFHIKDPETGHEWEAYAHEHLTPAQEKQMSTQPDMILQYAKYLESKYIDKGISDPEVRVEAYVTLNGRGCRLLVDPEVDLTKEVDGFGHKKWITSYKN